MPGDLRPRVVVASDSFKGSLTSLEVGASVRSGLRDARPGILVDVVPVADGGEGTVEAVLTCGFEAVPTAVHGPTGEPVTATLAVGTDPTDGVRTVVVELADACGLGRLPGGVLAPLTASSRGLGEAMRGALDLEPARVVIGIGGSASTDGGAGMLAALGARLVQGDGRPVAEGGGGLARIEAVELDGLDPRLARVDLVVAADVTSPLLGPNGAASVFAPQKGASPPDVALLEDALAAFARLTRSDAVTVPGAGAAGGVGFALMGVLGARRRPGIDVVLDLVGLDALLPGAALVVTGEGSLDAQTASGKAVTGVIARAQEAGVPVVAVCGRSELTDAAAQALGLARTYPLSALAADPAVSMRDARQLLRRNASRIASDWRLVPD